MRTMTLCLGCTGAGISLFYGSPGGRGRLFLGTARGASAYITRRLPATHRPGGNLRRRVNSHVPLFRPFPHLWHIVRLLPNKKFSAVLTGLIHLAYSQLKAHVKFCACVNFSQCSLMYWINAPL